MTKQPTCLLCGARLTRENIDFLVETMVDDLTDMLQRLSDQLQVETFAVDKNGAELLEDMASNICLACYITSGKASIEKVVSEFMELDPRDKIPVSALIELERVL